MVFDILSSVKIKKCFLLFSTYRISIVGKPAISLNMVEVHASKIMVPVYQATRHHDPANRNLTISYYVPDIYKHYNTFIVSSVTC
jgi:hypothetical protein